ncbi:MAG: hypothetical protein A2868_02615 [Candidatus Levybacteria bacterium RIFCSPHIGHO2_01_FULL_40_15b]|nr:MAG: hypothetical protein A2868_02615 [Candidatus Levybacteria bacterium RIFCSPHIGHO2_01_FULL_40_15b]
MKRKIFIVVAGGNIEAERHFEDTIRRKRTLKEVRSYLPPEEVRSLEHIYHGSDFIVWGSVPGPLNETRWEKMEPGDVVLIYNQGYIRFVGEIAAKVRNKELSRYFWREDEAGSTWELMYFIVNEEKVNVPIEKLNPLFGYQSHYKPQGFTLINQEAVDTFTRNYGDILGVLKTLEKGEELIHVSARNEIIKTEVEEQIEKEPTEHDEMQWRLIRLGHLSNCDVWIPKNDHSKHFDGNNFKEHVLKEIHESLEVPPTIKNIDVVWKFGPYSIKSAFEIEHSTSVYSGILRLSDLRAENPNSNYPLFIVAAEERRRKVFEELKRPTFSGPCLRLNEVIRFLGYKRIREIDESNKNSKDFNPNSLFSAGEQVLSN